MFNAIKKRLHSYRQAGESGDVSQARRWLFKGGAAAGVAVATFGGWIGVKAGIKEEMDCQAAYDQDVVPGDKILQHNGFEEISRDETDAMVQMFINDHKHKKQA